MLDDAAALMRDDADVETSYGRRISSYAVDIDINIDNTLRDAAAPRLLLRCHASY